MKKIKQILFFLLIASFTLQSCSNNDDSVSTEKSSALRVFLREMKAANNISSRTSSDDSNICFEFVYPLTLSYNNGTTVTVSSVVQLISILENETNELFIDGIAFPFDILVSGSTSPTTITNEEGFWSVIQTCDIETNDDVIGEGICYTFVYPFSLITINNQIIVVSSEEDLHNLIDDDNQDNYIVDFVYPFSVVSNNETIQINNAYDYELLINNCVSSNCNCFTIFDPVCVEIGSGEIIEFPNECIAECYGYSSDDFVDCNTNNDDSFEYILANCLNISYPVQVQYNGTITTAQNDAQLLQLYNPNLNQIPEFIYPITISFESLPNETFTVYNQSSMLEFVIELDCD
jgi:hypothetical protein